MSGTSDAPKAIKTGYWVNELQPANVALFSETGLKFFNINSLDFPDLQAEEKEAKIEFGDYGQAKEEVAEASGQAVYNLLLDGKHKVVLSQEGNEFYYWDNLLRVEKFKWVSEETLNEIRENRETLDSPSVPQYNPNPGKRGNIYWVCGPPGAGKSTVCQLLARDHGYIYYEVDAACSMVNPFPNLQKPNPTLEGFRGKALKGHTREDLLALSKAAPIGKRVMEEGKVDAWDELIEPVTKMICKNILRQQERLGGDFAVAWATPTKHQRDSIRKHVGPSVFFVVLSLSRECQSKRLHGRHIQEGEEETLTFLTKLFDFYEQPGKDEPDAVNVLISEEMSPQDVVQEVLQKINQI